jgi:hypothetical protein
MSAVTGTFRGGKIELHGPPPADWVDGTEVSVETKPPADEIDLTGDSPEAIAAWIQAMEELRVMAAEAPEAGDELQRILDERKGENKAMWDDYCNRIDRLSEKLS